MSYEHIIGVKKTCKSKIAKFRFKPTLSASVIVITYVSINIKSGFKFREMTEEPGFSNVPSSPVLVHDH